MELYEAHLILRTWHSRIEGRYRYCELAINRHAQHQVYTAQPFTYALCSQCGIVSEAFTPLPLQNGCLCCLEASHAGTAHYWIEHSNMFFWVSKLSIADCDTLNLALSQLFALQQSKAIEEVIL